MTLGFVERTSFRPRVFFKLLLILLQKIFKKARIFSVIPADAGIQVQGEVTSPLRGFLDPRFLGDDNQTKDEVVPREGLEPSRDCSRRFLKPVCLPFHHLGRAELFCHFFIGFAIFIGAFYSFFHFDKRGSALQAFFRFSIFS
jgi:hypothetical protein